MTPTIAAGSAYVPPAVLALQGAAKLEFLLLESGDDRVQRLSGAISVRQLMRAPGAVGLGLVDQRRDLVAAGALAPSSAGPAKFAVTVAAAHRHRRLGSSLADIGLRHARLLGATCLHCEVPVPGAHELHLLRSRGPVRPHPSPVSAGRMMCLRLDPDFDCLARQGPPPPPPPPPITRGPAKEHGVLCVCGAALQPHAPHPRSGALARTQVAGRPRVRPARRG